MRLHVALVLLMVSTNLCAVDITVTKVSDVRIAPWPIGGTYLLRYSGFDQINWSDGFIAGATPIGVSDPKWRISESVEYDGHVYFSASQNPSFSSGFEWYRFDPETGVEAVPEMRTAEEFGESDPMFPFVAADKLFYFSRNETGHELHVFDGATSRQVADVYSGPNSSVRAANPPYAGAVNDRVILELAAEVPEPQDHLFSLDPVSETITQIGNDRHYFGFANRGIAGFVADGKLFGQINYARGRVFGTDGHTVEFAFDIAQNSTSSMYQDQAYVRGVDDDGFFLREFDGVELRDVPVVGVDAGEVFSVLPGPITNYEAYKVRTELGIEYAVLDDLQLKVLRLFDDVPARFVSILSSPEGYYIRAARDGDASYEPYIFRSDDLITFEALSDEDRLAVEWLREPIGSAIFRDSPEHDYTPMGYFYLPHIVPDAEDPPRGLLLYEGTRLHELDHVSADGTVTKLLSERGAYTFWHNDAFYFASPDGTYKITASDAVARVDYNHNSVVDVEDLDIQRRAMHSEEYFEPFDLKLDGKIDIQDRIVLVEQFAGTTFGDANLDGVFDSSDLVSVFMAAEFENSIPGDSTWTEGDWDGDGDFGTSDFVIAFQRGNYERNTPAKIPEPACQTLIFMGLLRLAIVRKRWRPS